jgi:hypothetical protein
VSIDELQFFKFSNSKVKSFASERSITFAKPAAGRHGWPQAAPSFAGNWTALFLSAAASRALSSD